MAQNPYAAPTATVEDVIDWEDDFELAGRGARLAAAVLNGLTIFIPVLLIAIVVPATSKGHHINTVGVVVAALGSLCLLGVFIADIVLLYRNGQSIGKKIMDIKIVRTNGDRCALWRILVLRDFLNGLFSRIPLVGPVYGLVDVLLIFRENHRCIHDYLADTVVIKA